VAERCILGPGAELKSSFVFAGTKLAHFNFVGDSVLGEDVNLEAGKHHLQLPQRARLQERPGSRRLGPACDGL